MQNEAKFAKLLVNWASNFSRRTSHLFNLLKISHMTANAMFLPPLPLCRRSPGEGEVHFTTAAPTPPTTLLTFWPVARANSLFPHHARGINPLLKPGAEDLVQHVSDFVLDAPWAEGWKFGASLEGNGRRFDKTHYDSRWFDSDNSQVLNLRKFHLQFFL